MQMETHYEIRNSRILYFIGQGIFLCVVVLLFKNVPCPFKKIFHIPCPFCGMTRSYKALTKLDIQKSIHYNILFLPTLMILIVINSIFIYEIVKNKKILHFKINKKKIIIVIVLMITSMIWGIIHNV